MYLIILYYIGIILYIIKPPAPSDYLDYIGAIFAPKMVHPLHFKTPPLKILGSCFFIRSDYGNLRR